MDVVRCVTSYFYFVIIKKIGPISSRLLDLGQRLNARNMGKKKKIQNPKSKFLGTVKVEISST
jgi:hypothetical protein